MAESVAGNFKDLPMAVLIGAPLTASCDAQVQLASAAWEFYQKISFTDDKGTPRMLEFTLDRPVETPDGGFSKQTINVKAPFVGLVPIPSLLIDDVNIDFQMEVSSTTTEKDTKKSSGNTHVSAHAGFGWWGAKASISGKISSSKENTRSTNQTAKYQVHVSASQQPQTEGLSKLMDIMASCIVPLEVAGGGGTGGGGAGGGGAGGGGTGGGGTGGGGTGKKKGG